MTRQLTTRSAADRALLELYRRMTPNGRKAVSMWAQAVVRLGLAPALPKRLRRTGR